MSEPQRLWPLPTDPTVHGPRLDGGVDTVLAGMRRIAVVGLSADPSRTSHGVAAALQRAGYEIVPVNPTVDEVLGQQAYPDLASVPGRIDVVDVFRRQEHLAGVAREAAERDDVGAVWMQLGLASEEARRTVLDAGKAYVEDLCLKVEVAVRAARPPSAERLEAKVVLLDLDDTVLDHDQCERRAARQVLERFGLPADDAALDTYVRVNGALWADYRRGLVDARSLKVLRWERTLDELDVTVRDIRKVSSAYLAAFSRTVVTIPGAVEAAWWMARRSRVVVATNGFAEVQGARATRAGLDAAMTALVSSEEVGVPKPDPALLRLAVERSGVPDVAPADVVMVGDQLATDIAAGVTYGARTVWIAPDGAEPPPHTPSLPDLRVARLRELA